MLFVVVVLILAGGSGSRTGQNIPKQFVEVKGKPIIIYTLEAFQKHSEIDSIIVVSISSWEQTVLDLSKKYKITKLLTVVQGGETGQSSIFCGLKEIQKQCSEDDLIIIHEAVRPLVSHDVVTDSIRICKKYGGAVASLPSHDAMFLYSTDNTVSEQIPRDKLVKTQNPHTFPLRKLLWAHEEAAKRGITNSVGTSTLMVELGESFHLSKGSEKNFKLTTYEDIEIFKALLDI